MNKIKIVCLLTVALAGLLIWPVERLIFHLYFRDAEKKLLENPKLIRIGITGSYGKTSTKFILAEIRKTTYRDAMGRVTGTATTDSYGKTTYRDAMGRVIGTKK